MQSSGSDCPPAPPRVLIVEDNELHIKLMRDLLAFYGYVTIVAGLGAAAVDIARKMRPDLILLDIQLPDMAGTEVAGRLKADPRTRTTPIVAITAFAMPGDRERFLDSGCDDYIAKPISIGAILTLVERYTAPPGSIPRAIQFTRGWGLHRVPPR
jgi:two-component system cell cycle response regulator DivK